FSMRFRVTRWLPGDAVPADRMDVGRLVAVTAGDSPGAAPLDYAEKERRLLRSLAQSYKAEDLSPSKATAEAVTRLFQVKGVGLWHFTGHGEFTSKDPGAAQLRLADGS